MPDTNNLKSFNPFDNINNPKNYNNHNNFKIIITSKTITDFKTFQP